MISTRPVAQTATNRRGALQSLRATAVFIILVSVLPVLALIGWSAGQLRQAAREDVVAHALSAAEVAAGQHNQLLVQVRGLLAVVSRLPQLRGDPDACGAFLQDVRAEYPQYINLGVINLDGSVRCSALPFEPGLNLADRAYFRRVIERAGFAAGDYQIGRITGVPSINFGYSVKDAAGLVQAVAFVAISADWLTSISAPSVLPVGSTVKLLDPRKRLLVRYPALPTALADRPDPSDPLLSEALAARPDGGSFASRGLDGEARVYAYTRLGVTAGLDNGPYLVVGMPLGALQTRLDRMSRWQMVGAAAVVMLVAALTWVVLDRRAIAPARRLAVVARRLADGESGVRLDGAGGATEFQAVAHAFDHMAMRTDAAVRALMVLSAGNRVLLRATNEAELLREMCEVAVSVGGYRYAWVAYVVKTGLQQMATAGDDGGFAGYLQTHWDAALAHQTPTARALTSGQPVVLKDAAAELADHDLFEAAANCGLRAGLVLPLRVDGAVQGVLTIYAAQPEAFSAREIKLLSEMADDLSFGISTLRLRERHDRVDAHMRRLAYFDPPTGLPNQAAFLDQLAERRASSGEPPSVLVVDLQNHWELAATLGSACGDEFLRVVAGRLQALSPGLLARVAQSEFALVLWGADEATTRRYAERVLASLRTPANLSAVNADINATVGMALVGPERDDGQRVLQAARLAAREAQLGSGGLLAGPELEQQWAERLALVVDLRSAIDAGDLRLHLQPQLDLRSGRICGFEALARWHHPVHGDVPPSRFVPLAERTGLVGPLTYAVLEAAREIAARHAQAGLLLPIAVNISVHNLQDLEFLSRIGEFLGRWPLPRDCLHLELTETAVMDDPAGSIKVLGQLRDLGLPIYLDDFGSGYSSLTYLRELPLHGIKIDRAFIVALARPGGQHIVRTMIELGHALGLQVVAEGIEDQDTLDSLASLDCDVAQGYVVARPMASEALPPWLANRNG